MFGAKNLNLTLSGNFIKISALQDIFMHADLFANFLLDFAYNLVCISPTKRKSLSICHRKTWLFNRMVDHKNLRTDNMHAKFCAGLGPIWLVAVKSNALQWSNHIKKSYCRPAQRNYHKKTSKIVQKWFQENVINLK